MASAGPWRTATILPVRDSVPMISTPGPACSTHGARMNTARKSGPGVTVLGADGGRIIAVRQCALLATAFHPELTPDRRIHQQFVDIVKDNT